MKVAFVSLGCAKNLVNTEQMMALVRSAGHEITAQPEGADAAVLNTCGFIDSAKSEAIQNILELAELKKEGKLGKLLVTGCLSQRYQDELMEELPEVDGKVYFTAGGLVPAGAFVWVRITGTSDGDLTGEIEE